MAKKLRRHPGDLSPKTDASVGKSRRERRLVFSVMRRLRSYFGKRAALQLALRGGNVRERTGERWLAGKGIDGENFAQLLRSDVGELVLETVMGADRKAWPAWYARLNKQIKISSLRRGLAEQQRAIEALERGEG